MAEIVNLRRARKQVARKTKQRQAEDNRIRFGTPSELRILAAAERQRAEHRLSATKLERPADRDDTPDRQARPDGCPPEATCVGGHDTLPSRDA